MRSQDFTRTYRDLDAIAVQLMLDAWKRADWNGRRSILAALDRLADQARVAEYQARQS